MHRHLISRRKWLGLSEKAATLTALQMEGSSPVTSGLDRYTGPFGNGELLHLLKRTLFGITKADIYSFAGRSLDDVVNSILTIPTTLSSFPLNTYVSKASGDGSPDSAGVAHGETWVNSSLPLLAQFSLDDNQSRKDSVIHWNMGCCLNHDSTVYEKLILFWHNFFPIDIENVQSAQKDYLYVKTLRENAGASLRDLCFKMTKDLAMLNYLNGDLNKKNAPDENFGRELQELFTIGKVLPFDQRYTEEDVKAAARVLTGHCMIDDNGYNAVYGFRLGDHDTGDKQFSAFYNKKVIKGRNSKTAGDEELNDLLDMIFSTETIEGRMYSTAQIIGRHFVEKLYRFFVYYDIDDTIQANVITPLAELFVQNDFKILPVLRTLFTSQHFYDQANRGCYIKTPLDLTVGLYRTLGVTIEQKDVTGDYAKYNMLWQKATDMQLSYLRPPNVAGLPAFYQSPNYHQIWINSDTLALRQDFAKRLISSDGITGRYYYIFITLRVNIFRFFRTFKAPEDPNSLIDELAGLLIGIPLSDNHRNKIKTDFLLSGQLTDDYWTSAWNAAMVPEATYAQLVTAESRLSKLLDYMVSIEEFQLC